MPLILLWIAAGAVVGGGAMYALDTPETVINLPDSVTDDQVSQIVKSQPASIGDGLVAAGNGLAIAAAVLGTVYLFNRS
jgi:hypothetical protein